MPQGTVKWFDSRKGYGFIEIEDGNDLFVHHTEVQGNGFKTLNEGDQVEFQIKSGPKGDQAVQVVKK